MGNNLIWNPCWIIFILIIKSSIAIAWKIEELTETHDLQPTSHFKFDNDSSDEVTGILIDPLEEDDHEEFELYDIIFQSENIEDYDYDMYNDEQRQKYVDVHNIYRANFTYPMPEGSNMKMLEYNKTLEWAANEYVKLCKYEHGFAKQDNMTRAGQNLYKGPSPLPSRAIYLFYMEYVYWNFENQTCKQGKFDWGKEIMCGHFTQVVWGYTQHVGCARRSHCWPRMQSLIVNCHYLPGGNWERKQLIDMYRYGVPCTSNDLGDGNLCYKNLTVDKRMCQEYNLDCTCVLNCKNCATPNFKTCRCDCKEGWDYPDCGIPCEDTYTWVHPQIPKLCPESLLYPEWYKNVGCNNTLFLLLKCRETCGFCTPVNKSASPNRHCCGGKKCDLYNVLNTKTCECEKDCPTFGCLYEKSKTSPLIREWPVTDSCVRILPFSFILIYVILIHLLFKLLLF